MRVREKERMRQSEKTWERNWWKRLCVLVFEFLCTRARACECLWLWMCVVRVRTYVSPHTIQPWLCVLIYSTLLVISNGYPSYAWKCTQLFCRKSTWWRCYMLHDDLNAKLEIYRTQMTVCWIRRWTKNLQNDRHSHPTFPLLSCVHALSHSKIRLENQGAAQCVRTSEHVLFVNILSNACCLHDRSSALLHRLHPKTMQYVSSI